MGLIRWLQKLGIGSGMGLLSGLAVVAAPEVALKVIDRAIQVHGGGGVSQDFPLASMYAHIRSLRLADGPDEVHKMTIARAELRKHDPAFRTDGATAIAPGGGLG